MFTLLSANTNINFPNLGLVLKNVPSGIDVFGFRITFYGMLIGLGMLVGFFLAERMAKKTGQNTELYLDFALYAIIISVICTRLFYVIFNLDEFKGNLLSIFNTRTGGLMIYGGIIGALATAIIYCKIKKYSFWLLVDTGCIGLVAGQMIGRWGNFFNREVFGRYTNNLFAMQLNINDVSGDYTMPVASLQEKYEGKKAMFDSIMEIRNKMIQLPSGTYIQVHPTFLYESLWNLGLLIFLILFTKHKKFDGQIILLYLAGYGLGRIWIEGIRTDQLFLWGTPIPISQLISAAMIIGSVILMIVLRNKAIKAKR